MNGVQAGDSRQTALPRLNRGSNDSAILENPVRLTPSLIKMALENGTYSGVGTESEEVLRASSSWNVGGERGIRTLTRPLDSVSYRFHNATIAVDARVA